MIWRLLLSRRLEKLVWASYLSVWLAQGMNISKAKHVYCLFSQPLNKVFPLVPKPCSIEQDISLLGIGL